MACCAVERCDNPSCGPCTVNQRFRVVGCSQWVDGKPCRLVAGHWGDCQASTRKAKAEKAEHRESTPAPDLSGPRAASTSLAFVKRKREGAFRQQR